MYPSYHTTHTTKAERRAEESHRRRRRRLVFTRPRVASKEKTRPPPVYFPLVVFCIASRTVRHTVAILRPTIPRINPRNTQYKSPPPPRLPTSKENPLMHPPPSRHCLTFATRCTYLPPPPLYSPDPLPQFFLHCTTPLPVHYGTAPSSFTIGFGLFTIVMYPPPFLYKQSKIIT